MPTNEIKWYVEVSSTRYQHQRNVGVGTGEMKGAEEYARDLRHQRNVGVGTGEMKGAEEFRPGLTHQRNVGVGTGEMKGAIEGMKK